MKQPDVLIVTALKVELDQLLCVDEGARGPWQQQTDSAGFSFQLREFEAESGRLLNIAAARTLNQGGEFAVARATALVRELRPRCLAMCGICAGRRNKVFLGDVIAADITFKYDSGKLKAYLDENGRSIEEVLPELVAYNLKPVWKQACEEFPKEIIADIGRKRPLTYESQGRWILHTLFEDASPLDDSSRHQRCPDWKNVLAWLREHGLITKNAPLQLTERGRERVKCDRLESPDGLFVDPPFRLHVGPIATGGKVVVDEQAFMRLEKVERRVLGLEREAAAIALVADVESVDWMIVAKGVQDYADHEKDDSMREFAALASARFLLAFLLRHLPTIPTEPRSKNNPDHAMPDTNGRSRRQIVNAQLQLARKEFDEGHSDRGLAFTAHAVRADTRNPIPRAALFSHLGYRSWPLIIAELDHDNTVGSVAFSPDGGSVITASWNGVVQIWGARTGRRIRKFAFHKEDVFYATFSPDGQHILTASKDMTARIWDAQTGQPLTEPMLHEWWVIFAKYSPDGQRLVTACAAYAQLWDARTAQPIGNRMEHNNTVQSAMFSQNGRRIVTASKDQTARIWDGETGAPSNWKVKHENGIHFASFSSDSQRVVTASWDTTARIWDAVDAQPTCGALKHEDAVLYAAFCSDNQRILTATSDGSARIWDIQKRDPITLGEPMRHDGEINSAAFSPDDQYFATASEDQRARIWIARERRAPIRSGKIRHGGSVGSAGFSSDGSKVLTASDDFTAQVWDVRTKEPIGRHFEHHAAVSAASFSPDGTKIVTASVDASARIWDVQTARPIAKPLRHDRAVNFATFSPNGRYIVTASCDGTARIWDAQTGDPLAEPMRHSESVLFAAFSPDNSKIVTCSFDNTAQIWNAKSCHPLGEPMTHPTGVCSSAFSPDGKRILTVSENHFMRIWDSETGLLVDGRKCAEGIVSGPAFAMFSPEGTRIVTASANDCVQIWNADTLRPIGEPIYHSRVQYVSFSPDGERVVSASADGTVYTWAANVGDPVDALALAELAEAVALTRIDESNNPVHADNAPAILRDLRRRAEQASADSTTWRFIRWFLTDLCLSAT